MKLLFFGFSLVLSSSSFAGYLCATTSSSLTIEDLSATQVKVTFMPKALATPTAPVKIFTGTVEEDLNSPYPLYHYDLQGLLGTPKLSVAVKEHVSPSHSCRARVCRGDFDYKPMESISATFEFSGKTTQYACKLL